MKRIVTVISVLMASMLFSAIAILGTENNPMPFGSYGKSLQSYRKNECLLVAKNCATESSTVRQRVIDLKKEIDKWAAVVKAANLKLE